MPDLNEGEQLGRYTLVRRIGTGGMGEVWLAKSTGAHGFEKSVALKRILPQFSSNPHVVNMLVDEARISVLLNHPNVVTVLELGEDRGDYFIAMEHVDGHALSRLLRRLRKTGAKLDVLESCYIAIHVLEGLHAAHVQRDHRGKPAGIIHRDISPQNVLLSMDGVVKVIDFGIARARERLEVTQGPALKGKLRYMAPEQLSSKLIQGKSIDHRVDVFASGLVLYEMLANQQRFPGNDEAAIMEQILKEDTPDLARQGIIDRQMMDIVDSALEKDRERRFKDAAAFAAHLRSYLYKRDPGFTAERIAQRMRAAFLGEGNPRQAEAEQERARDVSAPSVSSRSLHANDDDDDRDREATRTAFRGAVKSTARGAAATGDRETGDVVATELRRGRARKSRAPAMLGGLVLGGALLVAGVLVVPARLDARRRGQLTTARPPPGATQNGASTATAPPSAPRPLGGKLASTDSNVDVIVEAEPATTRIALADQPDPKFVSPARLKARMGDALALVFEADGFETERRTFVVASDPARLKVELRALPVDLVVRVWPQDAVVTVDGGKARPGMKVTPGRMVEVRAEHPFARTQVIQGVPRAGETYVVEIKMPEVDAPKGDVVAKGTLVISSKPSGAEVFIDGKKLSRTTPLEEQVLAGTHRIIVRAQGGEQSITVEVAEGSVTKRNIVLE
jgi:serine/threonine protein kinase